MLRHDQPSMQKETEYFDQLMLRVTSSDHLRAHADALIQAAIAQEPLFAEALTTPQDIRYHAEGARLHDHVQLILMGVFGVLEGEVDLLRVEEFARLKGYEAEFSTLQQTIKENASFMQVFAMCHDVAKYLTVTFSAPEGSLGAKEGFATVWSDHFDEAAAQRAQARVKYWELFDAFANEHPFLSEADVQVQFYLTYQIKVHYHRHGRHVHTPVYAALVDRFCRAFDLPGVDHDLMVDLISHHMEVITDFESGMNPAKIQRYVKLAKKRGYDPDEYLHLMQACLLIDAVFGCKRFGPKGYWHEPAVLIHCLQSEHNWAPWRRAARQKVHEERKKREQNQAYKAAGLDGVALMDVLDMDPGPEFGLMLRRIHAAIQGQGEMPTLKKEIAQVLEQRIGEYYKQMFSGKMSV